MIFRQLRLCQFCIPHDPGQDIVKVIRDTARDQPDSPQMQTPSQPEISRSASDLCQKAFRHKCTLVEFALNPRAMSAGIQTEGVR